MCPRITTDTDSPPSLTSRSPWEGEILEGVEQGERKDASAPIGRLRQATAAGGRRSRELISRALPADPAQRRCLPPSLRKPPSPCRLVDMCQSMERLDKTPSRG